MKSALCLLGSPAEARALAPTLQGLRQTGAALVVAAPPAAAASAEALGLSIAYVLEAVSPSQADLDALLARIAPALLLCAAGGELQAGARCAASRAGVALALLSPAAPATDLALEDFVAAAKREIEEIQPEQALRILETPGQEGWHFLDVREPDEYAAGHVPGARSSPRGFLEVRADRVHYKRDPWFEDRGRPLILYCGGGHRSALATWTLQRMGFTRVRSLAEGWTGWTERGYPVELPKN